MTARGRLKVATIVLGVVAVFALIWLMWSTITATVMADDLVATHSGDIITDDQILVFTQMAVSAAIVLAASTACVWTGVRLFLQKQTTGAPQ